MKECGGGQDKQLVEIIDMIDQSEKNIEINYISFLDGILFDRLFNFPSKGKMEAQRKRIYSILKKRRNSYFVNTIGFSTLIELAMKNVLR
jgi:hypothetical protein